MEQQIQDLIASIRKEGIDTAKAESGRIISEAKAEAERIVKEAESQRDRILEDARKQLELDKASSEASIKQAARDVSISLRRSIEDEFSAILRKTAGSVMHGEGLVSLIAAVLSGDASGKAVDLPADDLKALSSQLESAFADEIRKGLEFRPSSSMSAGFRVTEKDGSGYIDYSDEECAKLIMPYLSENLREIIG